MFVTGLTYQNLTDREPALADFDTSYATSFTNRIAEAKGVIDNRLRALGYDLDKIGKKTDVWDWDNDAETTISSQILTPDSTQNLLILMTNDTQPDTNIIVQSSQWQEIINETFFLAYSPVSFVLPYLDSVSIIISLTTSVAYTSSSIKAYLTDPAIYYVHLYKSLEIIYESMRSNPGDLFEMKSLYYGNLYEREFQNLVTFYDSNGDGIASIGEQQSFNRIDLSR
jgi:hypothetical protein